VEYVTKHGMDYAWELNVAFLSKNSLKNDLRNDARFF